MLFVNSPIFPVLKKIPRGFKNVCALSLRSRKFLQLKNLEELAAHARYSRKTEIRFKRSDDFDVPDEGLKQSHEQFHDLSRRSLRETDPAEREISGITFTMKKKDLPRAKELIRQLIFDLSELGKTPAG